MAVDVRERTKPVELHLAQEVGTVERLGDAKERIGRSAAGFERARVQDNADRNYRQRISVVIRWGGAKKDGSKMRDDRLPDHSRLVYVVIAIVLLIVAIPLILLLILHVLASDVMH